MRVPLDRTKRTVKVIRMKPAVKSKKPPEAKQEKDYISETISFVIKGKLTPIKPAFVAKKVRVGKKVVAKKVVAKKVSDAIKTANKVKPAIKKGKVAKVAAKSVKKTSAKLVKKSAGESVIGLVQETVNKAKVNVNINKVEPVKKVVKPLKKVKSEVADVKKKPKKEAGKRAKSPQKAETSIDKQKAQHKQDQSDQIKKAEDIKTKQTIEKLLKQANRALKQPQLKSGNKALKKAKKSKEAADAKPKVKLDSIKNKAKVAKQPPLKQEIKKPAKRKVSSEGPDDASTSDDLTLDELRQPEVKTESPKTPLKSKKLKVKSETVSDTESKSRSQLSRKQKNIPAAKSDLVLMKKRLLASGKEKVRSKENQRARKMKLFSFWNGPKRHRVASLNALAKVHCLYENETRGTLMDGAETAEKKENVIEDKKPMVEEIVPCTRTLRSVPGLRAIGKHWDMHDTSSSSEDNSGSESAAEDVKPKTRIKKEAKKNENAKKPEQKRRRNRTEIIMDLKDMVVRKRMASLNASAILAASYSVEKRAAKSPRGESETEDSSDYFVTDNEEESEKKVFDANVKTEEDGKLIEVRASPNKKVAVILNQDTDVTITGVYVNSTTRSTHHEGYCSIAGMQYRISATSHTQTAATAVATETLLQSSSSSTQENSNSESLTSCKSYTPLDALSNMQPPAGPGIQHGVPHQHMGPPQHVLPMGQHQLSPNRRHGCPSAFSAPHGAPPYVHPSTHHHPPPLPGDPGYIHGYYQPAGPLISVPHAHGQPPPITKSAPLSETSPTAAASPVHQPPAPSSNGGDSSDSEVIITSVTAGKETVPPPPPPQQPAASTYRYAHQYLGSPPGYSYNYPPHYYPTPPPAPSYAHHDLCYSPNPYLHHKYPPTYRRYLPSTQYYAPNPPDIYPAPPAGPTQPSQQMVTTTPVSASGSSYQPSPSGPPPAVMESYPPPPPPTLVEAYPHPTHYYPGYAPAPPPSCYTHSPATRAIPYIHNATYQSCPCPMQSCPKNVLTGPLTGDSKRSNITSIAKDSMPLPPVALALPLEPASATGPPSPARGSAGMPPPPSPAGATYQPPPPAPKQESHSPETTDCNPAEKKRKARIGKAMVRNNIAATQNTTMLLMCNPTQRNFASEVKREIESPKEKETEAKKEICSDDEAKNATVIEGSERMPEPQNLKTEEIERVEAKENDNQSKVELPPCIKTVAENVKVKNMKRKLSISKEKPPEPEVPSKKPKVESKYPNGSYKDLIKKDTSTVKMNNGKRKLISEDEEVVDTKVPKTKTKSKKQATKRKLSPVKDEESTKRLKQTKPLTASNSQTKHYPKEKEKNSVEPVQTENKEPAKKTKLPTSKVSASKKLAPAILDSLIAKNSIDRTIESVVSEASVLRTNKETSALKTNDKCSKTTKEPVLNRNKSTNKNKSECRKGVVGRRKSKTKEVVAQPIARVPRKSLQLPRWSNGWTWEGEPYESKVFLNSDETTVVRRCYPAMRHEEGDKIEARDCVLLKAGPRKNDLPFVAKIAYLWENPEDGEMMMSLLWYYRPEHTEQGRLPADQPDEVFASRHKDSNSVACIDDKCYVLTFHEYCRYRKDLKRLEEGIEPTLPCIPIPEPYPRSNRQPPSSLSVSPDMVFFCRRVYDFRQKRVVKNPS